jgi:hypothetical protein
MSTPEQALIQPNGGSVLHDEMEVFKGPGAIREDVRAEVDTQITTAKRYPRSLHAFTAQALEMATFNEEIAGGCFYALPREGKTISGPSARLAEIVLSAWGNIRADAKVVDIGETMITAEAMCWDLEKNTAIRVQVKRRITNKYGKRYSDDMIVVTGNAACSIALRNAVFKVIPNVFTQSIYEAARKVAIGDAETLANKRQALVDYFGKMGITPDRVFAVVGKQHVEDIGLDELATLRGLATAIKDGDTTVDEAFPQPKDETEQGAKKTGGVSALKDKIAPATSPESQESGESVEATTEDAGESEIDPVEKLRANVQSLFDEQPKSVQKNLMAGKPAISKMSVDELNQFCIDIRKASEA